MSANAPKPRAEFLVTTGKISRHHRERLAVIYVRQSTLQQVERHQESTRLQYGLVHDGESPDAIAQAARGFAW